MNHDDYMTPRRRLAMLCVLSCENNYQLPLRVLKEKVGTVGYAETMSRIRTDAAWLAEQGLINLAHDVVTLTERGNETVSGLAVTPGVSRPGPGEVAELRQLLAASGIAAAHAALRGE